MGGEVEEEQGVEGEANGHIVDEGGVQVTLARGPVSVVVQIQCLKYN